MKIALLPTVIVIAWIGLMADVQAVAQYGPVAPANGPVAPPVAAPGAVPGAAPAATPAPTTNDPVLIDNGLWADASVGSCCATCGGGSCCPPDWYTLQGTRIISRSNLRSVLLASQASAQGNYAAVADSTGTVYHVLNDHTTAFEPQSGSLIQSFFNPSAVLNRKQFGLGVAAGYDVTIGHYFCRDSNNNDHFVEFTFWGLNSWSEIKTLKGISYLSMTKTRPTTLPPPS